MYDFNELSRKILRYSQLINRNRFIENDKISYEFRYFFNDLFDNGWEHYASKDNFVAYAIFRKEIKEENVQSEIENIIDSLFEIKHRLEDEGYDSKFLIKLNNKEQQEVNPHDYRNPIYKYRGVGNKISTIKDGYVLGRIDFYLI